MKKVINDFDIYYVNDKKEFLYTIFTLSAVIAFILSFFHYESMEYMGYLYLIYAFFNTFLILIIKYQSKYLEIIINISIIVFSIFIVSIYVFYDEDITRYSLFYYLIAITFFLKGRKFSVVLLIILTLFISVVEIYIDTSYSFRDILTIILYLFWIFTAFYLYDAQKEKTQIRLKKSIEIVTKDLESALGEKEKLLNKLSHVVRNNLNVISSILGMQAMSIEDKIAKKILLSSQQRIFSIGFMHTLLYESQELENIDTRSYITKLINTIVMSHSVKNFSLEIEIENINLPIYHLMSIGLIINELVLNSLKYAFVKNSNDNNKLSIKFFGKNGIVYLIVEDNGIGIQNQKDGFGLQLIEMMCMSLKGKLIKSFDNGTRYEIRIGDA